MRQLNPSTNLVVAVLAGLGLLASLTLPWFAAPVSDPVETDGPIERGAFQVAQVFATSAKGTVSGADAVGPAQSVLFGLVVAVVLVSVAVLTPTLRRQAEDLMRVVVVAAPVVVIVVAATHPGVDTAIRIHYGLLISLALTVLMGNAAWHGANMRAKAKPPVRPRYGTAR